MTLLGHLITGDVRRLRTILAATALLTVAAAALAMTHPSVPDIRWFRSVGAASMLVWIARLLVTLLTAALLVHGHPLVGTTAFWLTRPIPRMPLLASKAIVLSILLIALPLFCELVFMRLYDVPAGQMARVAVQTLMLQTLWITVLMCGASITRNVAGFGLLIGGVVVALAVGMLMLPLFLLDADEGVAFVSVGVSAAALQAGDSGGDVVLLPLVTAAGIAMLVVQYRTRSRLRSVATGLAGIALAWLIAIYWPWRLVTREMAPQWANAADALVLSGDGASMVFHDETRFWGTGQRKWRFGRASIHLRAVEPGWRARIRLATSALILGDGTRIGGRGFVYGEEAPMDEADPNQEHFVGRRLLDVDTFAGFGESAHEGLVAAVISATDFAAHAGATAAYEGTFIIELSHMEVAAALPLRAGVRFQEAAARFQIDEVRREGGPVIRVRRSNASTAFDRRAPRFYTYYLRNRLRRQAIATSVRTPAHETFFLPFAGAASHVSLEAGSGFGVAQELVMPMSYVVNPGQAPRPAAAIDVNREWLTDAELVIVRTTEAGAVTRTLTMRDVRVGESPAGRK